MPRESDASGPIDPVKAEFGEAYTPEDEFEAAVLSRIGETVGQPEIGGTKKLIELGANDALSYERKEEKVLTALKDVYEGALEDMIRILNGQIEGNSALQTIADHLQNGAKADEEADR